MNKQYAIAVISMLLYFFSESAFATVEELSEEFVEDAQEGAEVSPSKGKWLPVPIPVANPTVGVGLQPVLIYMHPEKSKDSPNTTSGIAGMYTNTESWAVGAFHDDYFNNDKIRFTGFLGRGEFNLKFYGIGDDPLLGGKSIPYQFRGDILSTKLQMRVPKTKNWFGGLYYILIDSEIKFKTSNLRPEWKDLAGSIRTAGLGGVATYDSRDNNYYPTSGQWLEVKWVDYSDTWGGDYEYSKSKSFINHYQSVRRDTVIGLRARLETSDGETPFFHLSTLDLRGFSRDRYRDQHTLSLNSELRYRFKPRWGAVAFLEAGWFDEEVKRLGSGRRITSYGAGIRWQVTQDKKLNLGLDAAISTDDKAAYIQVGEQF